MANKEDNMSYDQEFEITRSRSVDPPAHYIFQINSYSTLSKIMMRPCESGEFEVDGYNWKLILYPNGDEKVEDHISLYLALTSKEKLPLGGELRVIFRFFIYDQINDNYLTIQDGKMIKYTKRKSEHGLTHFLSHNALKKDSNGFIVGNCCKFGVEVSILKASNKLGESLTIIEEPQHEPFMWSIKQFSTKTDEFYVSEPFIVKGIKWSLWLYPNGHVTGNTTHLSLYVQLDSSETMPSGKKIYATCFMSVYNFETQEFVEKTSQNWFREGEAFGFHELILSRKDLSSHLLDDVLFLGATIVAMSTVQEL